MVLKTFMDEYQKRFCTQYISNYGKDLSIFKNLLKSIPTETIKILIVKFFYIEDDFLKKTDYGVGVFKSQINKLMKETQKDKRRQV